MTENESRLTKRNPDGSVGINDFRYYNYTDFQKLANKLAEFEAIGTIDEFKALKEKSVAKKVLYEHIPKTSWTKEVSHYLCPSCRGIFSFGGKPYCSNCGQKLDWQ